MRTVPIHDLKRNLAALVDLAAGGEPILITRRGKPVATLVAPQLEHVHMGRLAGKVSLAAGPRVRGCEDFLEVLQEDRRGGPDR